MTHWQIAIETSMRQGSVALLAADRTVRQTFLAEQGRTAQTLAPAVAELLSRVPEGRPGVQLVSVAAGPGSFTGLRIGVTSAKTLAYALGCPVVACDTLAAIVHRTRQEYPEADVVDAAIDAYRGQVYCRRESRSGEVLVASQAKDREAWIASFGTGSADRRPSRDAAKIIASGNAWARVDAVPVTVDLAPEAVWQPTAAIVGTLGWAAHRRGESIDPMRLRPDYLRQSAAEEKAAAPTPSVPGPQL